MKKFLLLVAVSSALRAFGGIAFTSSLFNRLNLSELEQFKSKDFGDETLIKFFQAERLHLEGKIHSSEALLKSIEQACDNRGNQLPKNNSIEKRRFAAVCVLSSVGFGFDRQSLSLRLKSKKLRSWLDFLQKNPLPFEENAYFEGRLLCRLPEDEGGDVGKSILALESLRRLRPDLTSADFFLGQIYEAQSNEQASHQAYERAKNHQPPDNRFRLVFGEDTQEVFRGNIPLHSRFYVGVVSNPSGGSGIIVGKKDDRLGDTKRKLDVSLSAQSRGVFGGRVVYDDEESVEPFLLKGRLSVNNEIDQFFGFGSTTSLNNLTEVHQTRVQGELGIKRSISKVYYQVGGELFYREPSAVKGQENTNAFIREKQLSFAPHLEVGWDLRDNLLRTRRGSLVFARLGISKKGILSTHDFELYRMGLRQWFPILGKGTLNARLTQSWVSGGAPFGMLAQISGNPLLPGVRWGRFRDKAALAATLEWETPLMADTRLALFGNGATVGALVSDCWRGHPLWGWGGALTFGSGMFQSRLEVSRFANETLIQVGMQLSAE